MRVAHGISNDHGDVFRPQYSHQPVATGDDAMSIRQLPLTNPAPPSMMPIK